jgi:hypothetical protein
MKILRWIGGLLLALVLLLLAMMGLARQSDGPWALFPGGPLEAGELVASTDLDWARFEAVELIEMQLLEPPRSRTTWLVVRDGVGYIPCSLDFPPLKRWNKEALEDGRAILRIEGKRYPVELEQAIPCAGSAPRPCGG